MTTNAPPQPAPAGTLYEAIGLCADLCGHERNAGAMVTRDGTADVVTPRWVLTVPPQAWGLVGTLGGAVVGGVFMLVRGWLFGDRDREESHDLHTMQLDLRKARGDAAYWYGIAQEQGREIVNYEDHARDQSREIARLRAALGLRAGDADRQIE